MSKDRVYTAEEKRVIQNIKKTQPKICFYCKKTLSTEEITIDHIVPYDRGGQTTENNLVIACQNCNSEKSDMNLEEYMRFLEIKFEAFNSVPVELEQIKYKKMKIELDRLEINAQCKINEYDCFINKITTYDVGTSDAEYKLQKLQYMHLELKNNKTKIRRYKQSLEIEQNIIELMQQQQQKLVRNATEEYLQLLGKLKNKNFEEFLRKNLNLNNKVTNIVGNNNNVTINN